MESHLTTEDPHLRDRIYLTAKHVPQEISSSSAPDNDDVEEDPIFYFDDNDIDTSDGIQIQPESQFSSLGTGSPVIMAFLILLWLQTGPVAFALATICIIYFRKKYHLDGTINLASFYSNQFQETQVSSALDSAIRLWRSAITATPADKAVCPWLLEKLAEDLISRFKIFGDEQDLDDAIERYYTALELCPLGHLDHSSMKDKFISAFMFRLQQLSPDRFIDAGPPRKHTPILLLADLAVTFHRHFEHRGHYAYLRLTLAYIRTALEHCPPEHTHRPSFLTLLATALHTRYKQRGDQQDLALVIQYHETALVLRPPGHPDRHTSLSHLADALMSRYSHRGDWADVEGAIMHAMDAWRLCTVGHPDRPTALNNLAKALYMRFQKQGCRNDLDSAVDYFGVALELRPPGHIERASSLNNLAKALRTRFTLTGSFSDLDLALECYQGALELCPPGDPKRSFPLNNLALALLSRFEHRGDNEDLETSIKYLHHALILRPAGHPDRPNSLVGLARALLTRFERRSTCGDLTLGIEYYQSALELQPSGHPNRATLVTDLAAAIMHRQTPEDVELAFKYRLEALELRPPGHPERHASLHNLASLFRSRAKQQLNDEDLELAVSYYRDALDLVPPQHPKRHVYELSLADALLDRSARLISQADLNDAFNHFRVILDRLPMAHPHLFHVYKSLSRAHKIQFSLNHEPSDQLEIIKYLRMASTHSTGGSWNCLLASLKWVATCERYGHPSKLDAYRTVLHLLDQHIITASSLDQRLDALKLVPSTIASDATSCAIREGQLDTAIELVEQGRALLWAQLARFRTPIDDLRNLGKHGQQLARKFERINRLLDDEYISDLQKLHRYSGHHSELSIEETDRYYRESCRDWDACVEEIRHVEGFAQFLMPKPFSELQPAATQGPVIVVNISRYSCDAIVVLPSGPPLHVPLSGVTYGDISSLSSDFASVLDKTTAVGEEKLRERKLVPILRRLWEMIVQPVVNLLGSLEIPKGSRIWWCPTSKVTSLPLHAAGPYRKGEPNLSHIFISSYTPTLSALIRSREARQRHTALPPPKFVAIGQAHPHTESSENNLQSVDSELERVMRMVPLSMSYSQLVGGDATAENVINNFRQNEWVHLACHGKQDLSQPLDSSFELRDKPLRLLDIIHANLDHHEFAFLSACHTAAGDKAMPDEVVHLAAGMQFSGFRSVIGTMWAVDDGTVTRMVSEFYSHLFKETVDHTRAAFALDKAAKTVDKKQVPLDQRIVFIHIGA